MNDRIVIIDTNAQFSDCLLHRLRRRFKDVEFIQFTPDDLRTFPEEALATDIVLFDDRFVDPALLTRLVPDSSGRRINLCMRDYPRRMKNAREISCELSAFLQEPTIPKQEITSIQSPLSFPSQGEGLIHTKETRATTVFSLTDPESREAYVAGCLRTMMKDNRRVIRVDLMPGIVMRNALRKRTEFRERSSVRTSGITEVLLKLESSSVAPEELLRYLQVGADGAYVFGLPDRSDDILDSRVDTLLKLLKLLRRLAESPEKNIGVICVAESLPFHTLRAIGPLFGELHVLLPKETVGDRDLADYEIHSLFSSIGPSVTKFVCEPLRGQS